MQLTQELGLQVGVERACDCLSVARSSFYAHFSPRTPRPKSSRPTPARALSAEERQHALDLLTSEAYVDKSPASIVAALLDEQRYVCSERTFYRILHSEQLVKERRNVVRRPKYTAVELLAEKPLEVWSWDITKLRGPRKAEVYSLYVIIDIYSRYIPGWLLADHESEDLAKMLIEQTCQRQAVKSEQLTIHADNGGVMKSTTLAGLFEKLGVRRTHSRPHCSNDNPYSEAQFKTLKYSAAYPKRFNSFDDAQQFCANFINEYNNRMYHSGIAMLTPAVVHFNQADEVIKHRQLALNEAYLKHPERFVCGEPKHKTLPSEVWINEPKQKSNEVLIS